LFHLPKDVLVSIGKDPGQEGITAVRIYSVLQDIFLFSLPPLALAYFCEKKGENSLIQPHSVKISFYLWISILWIVLNPFLSKVGLWNEKIVLPKAWAELEQSLKNSEEQIDNLIQAMVREKRGMSLLINLLIMALFPAIGEELFFRGGIQSLLIKIMHRPHGAIILGAIIFSAIHFQFYGFFPRFILGLVLGYLFYWSGSIWPGIFFHFLNNGVQIYLSSLNLGTGNKEFPEWLDNPNIFLVICSFILSALFLCILYNGFKRKHYLGINGGLG
jgi:membrane protease YdiL (CAAX protease family)